MAMFSNPTLQFAIAACLLAALVTTAYASGVSTLVAPFSATCALLALLPRAPFSQPRTILLSHIICIGIGAAMVVLPIALPVLVLVLLATWISIVLMALFRVVHAPAVAHAAILGLGNQNVTEYTFWAMAVAVLFTVYAYAVSLVADRFVTKSVESKV